MGILYVTIVETSFYFEKVGGHTPFFKILGQTHQELLEAQCEHEWLRMR